MLAKRRAQRDVRGVIATSVAVDSECYWVESEKIILVVRVWRFNPTTPFKKTTPNCQSESAAADSARAELPHALCIVPYALCVVPKASCQSNVP